MDLKNIKDIQSLAQLMQDQDLTTLEMQLGENKVVLSRAAVAAPVAVAAAPAAPAPAAEAAAAESVPATPADDENTLKAPLVGNIYLAPAPGKPVFVQAGDCVKKGQTLCIIEAMKVMNEFPAPRDGKIAGIHVCNEQLVEFGQPLFTLE